MSDTPRTDAAPNGCMYFGSCVDRDFAEQLERDLNTLIEAIRDECNIPEGILQAVRSIQRERE